MHKRTHDVAIFWDYENCPAPSNSSGWEVVKEIRQAAQVYGCIKVFRAYLELPEQSSSPTSRFLQLRSELQASGVSLTDCPHNGRKDVADKMILVDMMAHAIDNPAPWTYVLISGDRDFAYAISVLGLRRYQVILVSPPTAHISLKSQATACLDWSNMLSRLKSDSSRKPGRNQESPPASQSVPYSPSAEKPTRSRSSSKGRNSPFSDNQDSDSDNGEVDIMEFLKERKRQRRTSISSNGSRSANSESYQGTSHTAYFSAREDPILSPRVFAMCNAKPSSSPSTSPIALTAQRPGQSISIPPYSPQTTSSGFTFGTTTGLLATASAFEPNPGHDPTPYSSSANNAADSKQLPALTPSSKAPIPVIFQPLVKVLRGYQAKGFSRSSRLAITKELAPQICSQAKVESFGQYIALAERSRIVTQEGDWVTLRPEWA